MKMFVGDEQKNLYQRELHMCDSSSIFLFYFNLKGENKNLFFPHSSTSCCFCKRNAKTVLFRLFQFPCRFNLNACWILSSKHALARFWCCTIVRLSFTLVLPFVFRIIQTKWKIYWIYFDKKYVFRERIGQREDWKDRIRNLTEHNRRLRKNSIYHAGTRCRPWQSINKMSWKKGEKKSRISFTAFEPTTVGIGIYGDFVFNHKNAKILKMVFLFNNKHIECTLHIYTSQTIFVYNVINPFVIRSLLAWIRSLSPCKHCNSIYCNQRYWLPSICDKQTNWTMQR